MNESFIFRLYLWSVLMAENLWKLSGLKLRLKLTQIEKRWKCINTNGWVLQRGVMANKDWYILLCNCVGCCHHPSRFIVKSEFLVFVFLLCFVIKQTISLINFGKTSRRQMITTHFINHRVCHKSWRLRAFASETIWLKTLLCRMACPCCEWSHQSTNVHLIWLSFFFSLTEPNAMLNRHKSFSQAF